MTKNSLAKAFFWIGLVFLVIGATGIYRSGDIWIKQSCLMILVFGCLLYTLGAAACGFSWGIGYPISFDFFKQNQVYRVVEKMTEANRTFLFINEEGIKDAGEDRIVKIPEFLGKELKRGERFVKVGDKIAKLSP